MNMKSKIAAMRAAPPPPTAMPTTADVGSGAPSAAPILGPSVALGAVTSVSEPLAVGPAAGKASAEVDVASTLLTDVDRVVLCVVVALLLVVSLVDEESSSVGLACASLVSVVEDPSSSVIVVSVLFVTVVWTVVFTMAGGCFFSVEEAGSSSSDLPPSHLSHFPSASYE